MEQERFRRGPQTFHEGVSLRGRASEMLISSPVDNQLQRYQPSDPRGLFHPHFDPQFHTNYTQLLDSGSPSMVSKLDEIEGGGRQFRSTDEVCRFDLLQEPARLFDQARFSAQNRPVSRLSDVEFMIKEIPNKPHFSKSNSKPVQCLRSKTTKGKKPKGTVPRFRPNDEQIRLLENHFHSGSNLDRRTNRTFFKGLAKPTRALFEGVQEAGDATERQIAVWLKNKRSREKRGAKKVPKHELPDQDIQSFQSRCLEAPEQPMEDFTNLVSSMFNELDLILKHVDRHELENLCRALMNAPQIVCHAMGKEGHIMNKFASDLNTLGFHVTSLNDIATLPVSPEDLFIVSAGPCCSSSVSSLCLEAIRMGASVIAFTAHRTADTLFTDCFVRIPGQTLTPASASHQELDKSNPEFISFLPDGRESVMNMGSSYEVGLSLVHASVLKMLRQRIQKSILLR